MLSQTFQTLSAVLPVVYSDLNCPFCFVMNERLWALGAALDVLWVGVEHEPHLAFGRAATEAEQQQLAEEVRLIGQRAPEIVVKCPPFRSSTRLALALVAQVTEEDLEEAAELRTRLYRALWREGLDISDPAVLAAMLSSERRRFLEAPNFERVALATKIWREKRWERIPVIESPTRATYLGLGERVTLEAFLQSGLFSAERSGTCLPIQQGKEE